MPFLLRTWFSFLSGFIFPSPFPSPSLFWTNKLFSCLHWIFWSHSSSIRRCFGSMKYISCGYHFISSICTFWRLCLVKCKIAMLYKLLKGWRRRLYKFWLFKSEGISKEVMLLVKWAHLGWVVSSCDPCCGLVTADDLTWTQDASSQSLPWLLRLSSALAGQVHVPLLFVTLRWALEGLSVLPVTCWAVVGPQPVFSVRCVWRMTRRGCFQFK